MRGFLLRSAAVGTGQLQRQKGKCFVVPEERLLAGGPGAPPEPAFTPGNSQSSERLRETAVQAAFN